MKMSRPEAEPQVFLGVCASDKTLVRKESQAVYAIMTILFRQNPRLRREREEAAHVPTRKKTAAIP